MLFWLFDFGKDAAQTKNEANRATSDDRQANFRRSHGLARDELQLAPALCGEDSRSGHGPNADDLPAKASSDGFSVQTLEVLGWPWAALPK